MGVGDVYFSVIVPVYNVADYMGECVRSVLCQEGVGFEVLLVDDGSTDASGRLCDAFARRYAHVHVYHQAHAGLSEARNTGIRYASGNYLLFVDGDDFIAADSLRGIAEEIAGGSACADGADGLERVDGGNGPDRADGPDLVFLECRKVFYAKQGSVKKIIPMGDGVTGEVRSYNRYQCMAYLAGLAKYPASACTKAVKREHLLKHQLFFESGLYSEDLDWALRLFLSITSAGYCGKDYYRYRQGRAGSITSSQCEKRAMDKLYITQKWMREIKKYRHPKEKMLIGSVIEYMFRFLLAEENLVCKQHKQAYREKVKKCARFLGIRKDRKSKMIRSAYRFCGLRVTGWMLRVFILMGHKICPVTPAHGRHYPQLYGIFYRSCV